MVKKVKFRFSNDKTIYDLQGRILNKKPTNGFYIQGENKYITIK